MSVLYEGLNGVNRWAYNGPKFRVKIVNRKKKNCSLDSMGVSKTRGRGWGRISLLKICFRVMVRVDTNPNPNPK